MFTWRQINMLFFLPSYESFNVKVTWQIFYIPNVKTTMKFPEGTVFQKLHEIRLAGQERHNAATTYIPWQTTGNGVLLVTLENTPGWGFWGLRRHPRWQVQPPAHSQSRPWPLTLSAHFSWQRISPHTNNQASNTCGKNSRTFLGLFSWDIKLHHADITVTATFLQMLSPWWNS